MLLFYLFDFYLERYFILNDRESPWLVPSTAFLQEDCKNLTLTVFAALPSLLLSTQIIILHFLFSKIICVDLTVYLLKSFILYLPYYFRLLRII